MSGIEKAFEQKIRAIEEGLNRILVIHYACESFLDVQKGSPTIVSIAIKDLFSGQVTTFALCDYESEEGMLRAYFQFLSDYRDHLFVHWNMNDSVYGFKAIENRYLQITGEYGTTIPNDQVFDLDDLVEKKYGKHYAPHPKFYNLANVNRYSTLGLRSGKDEAELFKQGAFFTNKLSTIRKVHIISNILEDLLANRLLTDNRKAAILIRRIEENPLYKLIAIIVTLATLVSVSWAVISVLR